MFILHLALGGCLTAPPVRFGVTADTGGHIAYLLDAALAQADRPDIDRIALVTRLFEDAGLGAAHALASQPITDRVSIERIATTNRAYLEKEALSADLPGFTVAFLRWLDALPRRPDVIHAHFSDAATVALAARARFAIPVVYTPHALGLDKRRGLDADPCAALDGRIEAERRALARVDAVLVSTRDEAERQVAAYGIACARLLLLPPGVPRRQSDAGPDGWTLLDTLHDATLPMVLAIARPVAKKNLAALVRAFARTPALAARANLVILAGQHDSPHASPEERAVLAELVRLCAEPALRGRVALPPAHDGGDVARLYALAAQGGVFVNPALHEPFGLTVIEAAAAGVPVVTTRNGGPSEIVATIGHGLLVDPRDEAAIGQACLRIVSDAALHRRFSDAGRAGIGHYDWRAYAAGSTSLYDAVRRRARLLVCDIDGTLTGSEAGAAAFSVWRGQGLLPFIVATGRDFDAARAVLGEWRLPMPDAFIVDVGTRIMLPDGAGGWREDVSYADSLDQGWDLAAVEAILHPLTLTPFSAEAFLLAIGADVPPQRPGLSPQPPETEGPHKRSFVGSRADASAIRAALDAAGLSARVVFSHNTLIDVLAPRAGKAAAIAWHAARLGFGLSDCVCAGDSGNDRDMLQACGAAIVVGNAGAELDDLPGRPGLHRVAARYAEGVMQGLALLGLAP